MPPTKLSIKSHLLTFIEPKAVKGLLEEYQEDNDYLLSWVKHEYMEKRLA